MKKTPRILLAGLAAGLALAACQQGAGEALPPPPMEAEAAQGPAECEHGPVADAGSPSMLRHAVRADERPSMGPGDAPVTIVTFSDFQCPYCTRLASTMRALRERYPDEVRVVFRQFPLPMHARGEALARASLAAQRQGAFWLLHDSFFDRQSELHHADLVTWAGDLGLDERQFERDLDDPDVWRMVRDDMAEARRFGVRGTPSTFINGRYVSGAQPLERFEAVVDEELEVARVFLANHRAPAQAYEAMRATWSERPIAPR